MTRTQADQNWGMLNHETHKKHEIVFFKDNGSGLGSHL